MAVSFIILFHSDSTVEFFGDRMHSLLISVVMELVTLFADSADNVFLSGETVTLCFKLVTRSSNDMHDFKEELATMVLPLLLIMPKVFLVPHSVTMISDFEICFKNEELMVTPSMIHMLCFFLSLFDRQRSTT